MKRSLILGTIHGAAIVSVVVLGVLIAYAADILTVDKDGTIRLRVSDTGKVTLNTNEPAQGDMRFTPRTADPTAPLSGDLWFNNTDKAVKYADGGLTKPLAPMTNGDLTLYVNGSTGDDNNNGLTSGTAVKTIQKAVNLVPPIVLHNVTIGIAAGTYRDLGGTFYQAEPFPYTCNVIVAGKWIASDVRLTLLGDAATPSNVRVTGADAGADTTAVRGVGLFLFGVQRVKVKGILFNYYTNNGVRALGGSQADIINVRSNNSAWGLNCSTSYVYVQSCQFNTNSNGLVCDLNGAILTEDGAGSSSEYSNNTGNGVYAQHGGTIYLRNSTGAGNGTGVYADYGGIVHTTSTIPAGGATNPNSNAAKQAYAGN